MTSFNRAISNLKARTRENTNFRIADTTAAAQAEGAATVNRAKDIANKLSGFSKTLGEWKQRDIKEKTLQGEEQARKDATSDAQKLAALTQEKVKLERLETTIGRTKEEDTRYLQLKKEILDSNGVSAYPDADRIANLSPWARVGYAKEKLRSFNESYEDKLAHEMANSEKAMTINGVHFSPKELSENNINALAFKEAAVRSLGADIRKAANVDRFSPELLKLGGTTDSVTKAEEALMNKYRDRYNIDSSFKTRQKQWKEWQSIPDDKKTGDDLYRLHLSWANTVDKNGQLIGNTAGWDLVFSRLEQTGIEKSDPSWLKKYGEMELPEGLRQQLGAEPGTTYAKQWPKRFSGAPGRILQGMKKVADAEKDGFAAYGIMLGNKFQKEAMQGDISEDRLNWYKNQSRYTGGVLDQRIQKYETVSARDERVDTENIKNLMASNNGFITHAQLDEFHPRAAVKYREAATRHEAALKKRHNVDGTIEGALNESWTEAGMKSKEKKVVWHYAKANAQKDYQEKFNRLVAMGYDSDNASYLAMYGQLGSVTTKKGEPMPDFEGVVANIQRQGANSKYTKFGEDQKLSLKNAHIRVSEINLAKQEILDLESPAKISQQVIGGKYGQDRINEIAENIKVHGTWAGIRESSNALRYYEGISLGKRGMFAYGLIDAQLKAAGHPGIWPDRTDVEDTTGTVEKVTEVVQPLKYDGSAPSMHVVSNDYQDLINQNIGQGSVWNQVTNIAGWLQ